MLILLLSKCPQRVGEISSVYVLGWIESVREGTENNGDVYDSHAHMQVSVPTEMKIQDMIYAQHARRSVLNKAYVESKARPG